MVLAGRGMSAAATVHKLWSLHGTRNHGCTTTYASSVALTSPMPQHSGLPVKDQESSTCVAVWGNLTIPYCLAWLWPTAGQGLARFCVRQHNNVYLHPYRARAQVSRSPVTFLPASRSSPESCPPLLRGCPAPASCCRAGYQLPIFAVILLCCKRSLLSGSARQQGPSCQGVAWVRNGAESTRTRSCCCESALSCCSE